MTTVVGEGIDGANLLGFLAALGAQEHIERARPDFRARLSWRREIAWRPVWHFGRGISQDEIADVLAERLRARADAPELRDIGDDLPASAEKFREFLWKAAREARADARDSVDFAVALGSELYPAKGKMQDTAFRTMSGAGRQYFLKTIGELARRMTPGLVRAALFEPWRYRDERLSLRFDPVDDRRYALRFSNPSNDPPRTVWAANMLAAEGLRFFPTAVQGRTLKTTAFVGRGASQSIHWPMWDPPISSDVIRAVLGHPDLVRDPVPAGRLRAMGIVEVFRATRFTEGKYRNFSPSVACLG